MLIKCGVNEIYIIRGDNDSGDKSSSYNYDINYIIVLSYINFFRLYCRMKP